MNKKTGLYRTGDILFLYLFCVMAFLPICAPGIIGPVYAEVIINNFRTLGTNVDEEAQTGENNRNVTVTSTGSIEASGIYAIRGGSEGWNLNIEKGGSVTNTRSGPANSAILFNTSSDGTGDALRGAVSNNGTITSDGTGIKMGGGTVANNSTGTITGTNNAIDATGTITITNIGTITSTAGDVIHQNDRTAATIVNNTGTIEATVAGTQKTAVYIKGAGTVENNGTITSSEGKGVYFKTSGVENKVVNKKGASISGKIYGIQSDYALTADNSGTITSSCGTGIEVGAGGTITNSGTIVGAGSNGIAIWGDGTITNSGFISGYQNGITSSGYITLNNYGSVAGDKTSGVYLTEEKRYLNRRQGRQTYHCGDRLGAYRYVQPAHGHNEFRLH